jgi:hypothetical protein
MNKIFMFNSKIELVGKSDIEVLDKDGYRFNKIRMDIAIAGKPVIVIASEGIQRNIYAFAFDGVKISLVDKIEDIHRAKVVDLKYFNGHYFTYGEDGVINRFSLSK